MEKRHWWSHTASHWSNNFRSWRSFLGDVGAAVWTYTSLILQVVLDCIARFRAWTASYFAGGQGGRWVYKRAGLFIMQSAWTGRLSGSSSCYNQSYNSGCRCFCVQLKTPQSRRLARTAVKLLWSRRTAALASLCPLCVHMNVGSAFSSRSVTASFKQPPCVLLLRWSCGCVVNSASRSCPSRCRCFYFAAVRLNMQQIQQADGRVIIFCFISEEHAAGGSCFFMCQKELHGVFPHFSS